MASGMDSRAAVSDHGSASGDEWGSESVYAHGAEGYGSLGAHGEDCETGALHEFGGDFHGDGGSSGQRA